MNKIFLKLFLSITILFTGFLFVDISKAQAECVVTSATFRPTIGGQPAPQISPTTWYNDTTPPYVYIDFVTSGCSAAPDNVFRLSITELDDAEGLMNINDNPVTNFINRSITVPSSPNFTVATRAGDDECDLLTSHSFECEYYIVISPNPATQSSATTPYVVNGVNDFNLTSNLKYNCHNDCDNKNWQWLGVLTTFQGVHPDDVPMTNTENPGGAGGPGLAGQDIDINIQNPIGPTNMTLVDFIEKIIRFALTVGIPIIAIAIIYSGLLFVTARGNDSQLETAKNAFTYAVIGGAILLGSFIFAKLIKETIESIVMINTYFG